MADDTRSAGAASVFTELIFDSFKADPTRPPCDAQAERLDAAVTAAIRALETWSKQLSPEAHATDCGGSVARDAIAVVPMIRSGDGVLAVFGESLKDNSVLYKVLVTLCAVVTQLDDATADLTTRLLPAAAFFGSSPWVAPPPLAPPPNPTRLAAG